MDETPPMTAKELVKAYGLARCAERMSEFSVQQLRGLVKIADDYGKAEHRSRFAGELQARRAATRVAEKVTPGSMLEALASVGGVAAPYAWFSLARDGRVVLHTWRDPDGGRMDGWRLEDGRWVLDTRYSGPSAPWRSLPQYTAMLRALDAQASLHGDVVFAALSTDISSGVGPAKRKPGSNVLLVNRDGTPARFRVSFDLQGRWHRLEMLAGQDCDVGAS
ncbi:MAG: hypothetical protein U5L03_01275 [Burkholderiaceae bacterium]|nr:hypothetical protein [Burkholderiaceae bacterium]